MTTITQRKKLSKAAWALVFIFIIGIIAIIVAATLGFIDLTPVSDGVLAIYMWASMDIVNAVLITIALPLAGVLLFWVVQRYFIGQKVTTTAPMYTPQGQTLSQPIHNQENETVIS
jgi:sterol desaturase/sphingolipid hydroxylase (fatty acid hydroxylase superfamily)